MRYVGGIVSLRQSDVLLASFPRSGNTLLRRVLAHALREEPVHDAYTFEALNQVMPELGVSPLWRSDVPRPGEEREATGVRFIKTHRPWSPLLSRPRAVWLVRSPLDAIASYHRYWTSRVGGPSMAPGAFLRDARRGLPWWIRHTMSWRSRAGLHLTYNEVREHPAEAAARVLDCAGLRVSRGRLEEAVRLSQPEKVRAQPVQGSDSFEAGFVFASDRPTGSGAESFSEADRAWASERLSQAGLEAWVS